MKKDRSIKNINQMIFAGGKASSFTLTASVLASWMWVTSIIGSTEAFALYGVWGAFAYVLGAVIAFSAYIFVLAFLRKKMPESSTYIDLISKTCSQRVRILYYGFAFSVAAYVLIEQAVGIALLAESAFGTSFKVVSFASVMVSMIFVIIVGMKGVLLEEKITFFVILLGFMMGVVYFGRDDAMIGLVKTALTFQEDSFGVEQVLIASSLRYFVVAIVIAFSQLLLDPAYYLKATMSKSLKQMKVTYAISGVFLWGIISLASSVFFGATLSQKGGSVITLFSETAMIVFLIVIFMAGLSTICHYMMGMFGLFTVEYYSRELKLSANDSEKILFGRVMTVSIGIFCALIALSLEGVSLLTIDMFCAVFFAAPCGPILVALKGKPIKGSLPLIAVSLGLMIGFYFWIGNLLPKDWRWFFGTVASFLVPILFLYATNWFVSTERRDGGEK